MRATGILLERLIRHRGDDWALVLALVKEGGDWRLRQYVASWIRGHFLPMGKYEEAEQKVAQVRAAAWPPRG